MNKCRRLDLALTLRRFYVIKNKVNSDRNGIKFEGHLEEGEKIRPIGSPDLASRVISKSFNDLIYMLFKNKFTINQHGFREGRGIHTAIFAIVRYIRKNPGYQIYEFDLKAFFNKVRPTAIYSILRTRGFLIADLVDKILKEIRYEYKSLEKESELQCAGKTMEKNGKKIDVITREGVPQGLSISPLLATLAMEIYQPPKGLFMYADDGLYIGPNMKRFERFFTYLETIGVRKESSKSRIVTDKFKFLGCEIDVKQKTLNINGKIVSFYEKNLKNLLKTLPNKYVRKEKKEG